METQNYKPEGYSSLSPYMLVSDANKYIQTLITVFNAVPVRRFNRPDGSVMHAEVRIDDTILMLSDATPAYPANNTMLHLYVADVDHVFSIAQQHGFTPMGEPVQQEGDQDKRGMLTDPQGNVWAVSTQMEESV